MANADLAGSVLLLAGGGIDSTACLHQLTQEGFGARLLHVDYGQAAATHEWAAVQAIARAYAVPAHQVACAGPRKFSGGFIEGRNALFVFLGAMYRDDHESLLCLGVHAGTPYFDCSVSFVEAAANLLANLSDGRARLIAPLAHLSKKEVVEYCKQHDVPIGLTYSCQAGGNVPCGSCLSCLDRRALAC